MSDIIVHLKAMGLFDVLLALLDILVVAFLFYKFLQLVRGTRALQLLKGLFVFFLLTFVSRVFQLETIHWLLQTAQLSLAVAIPVVFQPELRRALEQVGRGRIFADSWNTMGGPDLESFLDELLGALAALADRRMGAILVLERETGLSDIIETGIRIDGRVSREFLINIFIPDAPLHDGAVIIRGSSVMAAACFLPLTEPENVSPDMGSRHRAALGISEQSDAVAVVVSEETGTISLAVGGKLMRQLDSKTLREMLDDLLRRDQESSTFSFFNRGGGRPPWTAGFKRMSH